jgi:hypothetical protein
MAGPTLATVAGAPRHAVRKAGHAALAFTESKPIQFLARFGYVVRGLLYLVPGVLALELAPGRPGETLAPGQAITVIDRQPFRHFLLLLVLAGLVGYSIWGLTRALLDPWGRGKSPRGIGRRIGYGTSALAYLSFVIITLQLLAGRAAHGGGNEEAQEWASFLLTKPMGAWVLGLVGLGWIVCGGLSEIVQGWTGGFERDLRWERMRPSEHWWAVRMGRVGIVARGVVFTVIGYLFIVAALHHNPHRAGGMGEALREIARQPYGRTLLGAAALGLIVFGLFSILCARWMRTRSAGTSRRAHSSPQSREVRHGRI